MTGSVELAVPPWAERGFQTSWHPGHIAERFGLFTLIVLGETVLAATTAIKTALVFSGATAELIGVAAAGLVIVFSMWWLYFGQHAERILRSNRDAFPWGYGHCLIFASAAAVGSDMGVVIDHDLHPVRPLWNAAAAVIVPVAVYLICVWMLHVRPHRPGRLIDASYLLAGLLVVATLLTPVPLILTAIIMAILVTENDLWGAGVIGRR